MAGKCLFASLEPYKLTRVELTGIKLGHGSYASVVEVKYMCLKCAGKTIHEVLLEQGETNYIVRHFEEECRILSTLRHPNIVQFLGVHFNENKRVPMLVMEFLPMNLTSCIEKHGILPEEINYSILYDVALGLYFLHNQSSPIVHRDLSANNVLLTYNLDAKISDLGVARILNLTPLQASRLTQTPGTPAYMPPEVMVANPKYDRSIDEFSFGIMMIHIFSGQWPEPECPQIETSETGEMIPITEAGRRKSFLKVIGDDHPLNEAIISCIHNVPSKRMHAYEIVKFISEMVQQFPREQLDLIEHISRENLKETAQLEPQSKEHDSEVGDNEDNYIADPHDEYDDITMGNKLQKVSYIIIS
jgi:serine/threonine protein kinase